MIFCLPLFEQDEQDVRSDAEDYLRTHSGLIQRCSSKGTTRSPHPAADLSRCNDQSRISYPPWKLDILRKTSQCLSYRYLLSDLSTPSVPYIEYSSCHHLPSMTLKVRMISKQTRRGAQLTRSHRISSYHVSAETRP
jgi:hypothetical protein